MARITPLHIIPALIAAASHAGEITVEQRPFFIEKILTAAALPGGECTLFKISPKTWADFEILQIASHGAKVAKGEVLIRFDSEEIDKKLIEARRALAASELSLAQAENELKLLQDTAPDKLDAARRAAEIAKEENTYFNQVRRKAAEESAGQSLKRSQQILSNQQEELKQLKKMYEADDVTEDTEEIILIRQQDAVAAAEFALRMEMLDHKRTIEVTLPREGKTLADAERETSIALKKAEAEIPRSIELEKLKVDSLKTAHQNEKNALADLEADRAQFEIKAPADGFFYHGPIENGKWTTGDLVKALVPHGRPPVHRAFATFVPAGAKLALVSFLDEASFRSLKTDLAGSAILSGREDLEIPVKITGLAATPAPDGTYRADFSVTWPKEFSPAVGTSAEIRVIAYQQPAAIVVPTKALSFGSAGWTVEVRMADGKTESRSVKRGRASKEETEILSGLEVGQVVVVPEK